MASQTWKRILVLTFCVRSFDAARSRQIKGEDIKADGETQSSTAMLAQMSSTTKVDWGRKEPEYPRIGGDVNVLNVPIGDNPHFMYSQEYDKDYKKEDVPIIELKVPIGDGNPVMYSQEYDKDYKAKDVPIIELKVPIGDNPGLMYSQQYDEDYKKEDVPIIELKVPIGANPQLDDLRPAYNKKEVEEEKEEVQKKEEVSILDSVWADDEPQSMFPAKVEEDTVHENGLLNLGRPCACLGGPCSYCGTGFCCKMRSFRRGCDGANGGEGKYLCTSPPPNPPAVTNLGKECWNAADCTSGRCGYCGSGLCCRRGREEFGCNGTVGGVRRHECVWHEEKMADEVSEQARAPTGARAAAPVGAAPAGILLILAAASWRSLS